MAISPNLVTLLARLVDFQLSTYIYCRNVNINDGTRGSKIYFFIFEAASFSHEQNQPMVIFNACYFSVTNISAPKMIDSNQNIFLDL